MKDEWVYFYENTVRYNRFIVLRIHDSIERKMKKISRYAEITVREKLVRVKTSFLPVHINRLRR